MEYRNFFALLGGLALFLYGMHQMSEGLNAAAGEKMKQILERLTANRFLGVLVGAAITQAAGFVALLLVSASLLGVAWIGYLVAVLQGGKKT